MKFRFSKISDWIMIAAVLILIAFGIITIYSTSYHGHMNYVWSQAIFTVVGLILLCLFTFIDYRAIKTYSVLVYIIGMILLIGVLILGKTVYGASRWINFGFFQFQPSEFFKLIFIIILARYLSDNVKNIGFKQILTTLLLAIIPIALIAMEPDLGTAMILIFITVAMLIVAGIRKLYLLILAGGAAIFSPAAWFWVLHPYQKVRILTFLNPQRDPFSSGYNVLQSMIAVGSGQFFGRGLGQGSQSQLNFLPVQHTDFIFAVFAEELGFLGSIILLAVFGVLLWRVIQTAQVAKDDFGTLIASGIATMFIFQILINIGMNIGIMPVTGVPLPFVSAGGSSLIASLVAVGILQSIIMRHKNLTF